MSKINIVDKKLAIASKALDFVIVTPTNIESEKLKFFKRNFDYNPIFRYRINRQRLEKIKLFLKNVKVDGTTIGFLMREKIKEYLAKIDMFLSIGTETFSIKAVNVYGKPSLELFEKAEELLKKIKKEKEAEEISAETIKKFTERILEKHGLRWEVKLKKMPAKAAISFKQIFIKDKEKFAKSFIKRLIAHEIGTHIFRVENGLLQPYRIFARGLPSYLATEEGLALFNEEQYGILNKNILRVYAGRVLSTKLALKKSFKDVFAYLLKYFNKDHAWTLTLRAKRGLAYSGIAGGFTKDYLYLKGYFDVKNFVKTRGMLEKLYYGKVGIQHIELLNKIKGLKKPRYIFTKNGIETSNSC